MQEKHDVAAEMIEVVYISHHSEDIEIAASVMDYTLHIEVLDHGSVLRDDTYPITKAARLGELLIIRIMASLLVVAAAAGKSEAACEEAYYAGLLHDVGIPELARIIAAPATGSLPSSS